MSTSAQAAAATPKVEISDLHKFFGELHVLRGIDLIVPPGSVTVLIGPSGSGKSTLLRCINELESIDAGRIKVDGELIGMREVERRGRIELHALSDKARAAQRAKIGMVFQRFNLFPHMTALQNVMEAPVLVKKTPKAKARERGIELLERVGLGDRLDHYPSQLSGGQQQRVGIARALADDPAVLLCDEPTSALDPETTRSILDLIKNVRDTLGLTVIIITHEMSVVRQVCDSVSLLEAGKIVESGRLEDIVLDVDSRLSREIVPFPKVPEAAVANGESVIDVSITAHPGQPAAVALMSMVAELGGDIAAGVFETIGQAQIGRLAVTVPGSDTEQAMSTLRQAGIAAEVRS